jgi:hypothetical protein
MFPYYGSKSELVKYYPKPLHHRIVEPFAGSARYSLMYWENDITLVDAYEVVIKVWQYLKAASPSDIMGLPKLIKGADVRDFNLSEPETLFLQMMAGVAVTTPRNKVSYFAAEQNGRKNRMKLIANNLYKIRHWNIVHGSYEQIPNTVATWFIDPPYEVGGSAYKVCKINYQHLREWSLDRRGQVIICENEGATWLPAFYPIRKYRGVKNTRIEGFYTNNATSFANTQMKLNLF